MKIFLAYPNQEVQLAKEIAFRLRNDGHQVFFDGDPSSLPPGDNYDAKIRRAVQSADVMVVLLTSRSLHAGRYLNTEISLAQERWPLASGHVLPVAVGEIDIQTVDPYLRAVTLLKPPGNIPADVAHAVEGMVLRLRKQQRRWVISLAGKCILAIASLIALVTVVEFYVRKQSPQISISQTEGGAVVFETNGRTEAIYLLSSGSLWDNTAIPVPAGYRARIRASGRVTLAIHHVVKAAETDDFLVHTWLGPEGGNLGGPFKTEHRRTLDQVRQELLICTAAEPGSNNPHPCEGPPRPRGDIWGALIGYLRVSGDTPGRNNPRPVGRRLIGAAGCIDNRLESKGELWFVVNDSVLNEHNKEAYVGPTSFKKFGPSGTHTGQSLALSIETEGDEIDCTADLNSRPRWNCEVLRWQKIVEAQRWDIWYEDNVGQYLIGVTVEEGECPSVTTTGT